MKKLKIFILCIVLHQNMHPSFLSNPKNLFNFFVGGFILYFGHSVRQENNLQGCLRNLQAKKNQNDNIQDNDIELTKKINIIKSNIFFSHCNATLSILGLIVSYAYLDSCTRSDI